MNVTDTHESSHPVFRLLTQTALHTLNTYGDGDPDAERILQGLNRLAEVYVRLWEGLGKTDPAELDRYNNAVAIARENVEEAETKPISMREVRDTHLLLREFVEELGPRDAGEEEIREMRYALSNLWDFWETSGAAV
jgi:hypothetical protein